MMRPAVAARRRRLLPPPARKPPTPAVESARAWKAPGHRPPIRPDLPTPVGNPSPPTTRPGISTATHSRGDEVIDPGKKEESMTDYAAPESGQGGHLD
jgi:hypothetical protein